MKQSVINLVLLFVLAVSASHAQTLDSAVAFYPMSRGNIWQFHYRLGVCQSDCYLYYFTLGIVGDTLMPNGKMYKIQVEHRPGSTMYTYLRLDTLSANVYAYYGLPPGELLLDSLRATPGNGGCYSSSYDTVAGFPTVVKSFTRGIGSGNSQLAYGIGPVGFYAEDAGNGFPYYSDFVYAKINGRDFGTWESVRESKPAPSQSFELLQNYPNPFNPSTTIRFALPKGSYVTLTIFNALGQKIATLVDESQDAGRHEVKFDGTNVASGVYFSCLRTRESIVTKCMMLVR